MPCSQCRASGHNIKTCPQIAAIEKEIDGMTDEQAANMMKTSLGEDAVVEMVADGMTATFPGAARATKWMVKNGVMG